MGALIPYYRTLASFILLQLQLPGSELDPGIDLVMNCSFNPMTHVIKTSLELVEIAPAGSLDGRASKSQS